MLHHLYTETPADVKRTVFNFMLTLPRLWRIPLFTAQKFGEFFSGHLLRIGLMLPCYEDAEKCIQKELQIRFARFYMLFELYYCYRTGYLHWWIVQFTLCVWCSMFQIVASHDFEVVREQDEHRGMDWGIHQVTHALDTYITGSRWVDIWLSAGLSCHRVHHVLPYQGSGFANIVCEDAVKATCKEFDIEWMPTRNLLVDRFFPLMYYYLTAPAQIPANPAPIIIGGDHGWKGFVKEHLSITPILKGFQDIGRGFLGESI
jgi:hypothetical protein